MENKSCYKKTQQKSFWLNRDQAAACCRAHPVDFNGNLQPLIELWNNEDLLMKQGKEVASCDHCWIYERQGIQSYRQQSENDSIQKYETIDINFSNLCNHMCVYCSPKYSSMWEESIQKHGMFQLISSTDRENLLVSQEPKFTNENLEAVLNYIASRPDKSIILSFLGGEPLMQQRNIEKILEISSKKISRLLISTNLNPPTNRIMKSMFEKIDTEVEVLLSISMDASPEFNYVSRSGFDQFKFLENLSYVQKQNAKIIFTGVCNAISIFDLNNLIQWHQNNNHSFVIKPLNNPNVLQVKYLPLKYRQKIWQGLSNTSNLPEFIYQTLHLDDEPAFYQFQQYNYLNQYFTRTGIDPTVAPNELFVEWWKETHRSFAHLHI